MKNPENRGSLAERHYIVEMFVELDYGDKNAGDPDGGDYAQLYLCAWDVCDESYVVVTPKQEVWRGQVAGRTWEGEDFLGFDLVMRDYDPLTDEDNDVAPFFMALKESYDAEE